MGKIVDFRTSARRRRDPALTAIQSKDAALWMIDVLEDMAEFARTNDLADVAEHLRALIADIDFLLNEISAET